MTIKQIPTVPTLAKSAKFERQETTPSITNKKISISHNPKEILFSLSETNKKLLQPQTSDINMDKISQLKKAIQSKVLQIESKKIAKNILVNANEYIQLTNNKEYK